MALTHKQRAFAEAVAAGSTLAAAYRSAYECSRMKPSTVRVKACELARNGNVAVAIEELRAKQAEAASWSREEAVRRLRAVNDKALEKVVATPEGRRIDRADAAAFTETLDRLNELCGVGGEAGGEAPAFYFDSSEIRG